MKIIPLSAVESQVLQFVVAGQNCQMSVYTKNGYDYFDPTLETTKPYIAVDFAYNGIQVTNTQLCLNQKRLLLNRQYLGFVGDFMFVDTQFPTGSTGEDPQWEGLGARWLLIYLEAADVDITIAPINIPARPGPGPALPPPVNPGPPPETDYVLTAGSNSSAVGYAVSPAYGALAPNTWNANVISALSWDNVTTNTLLTLTMVGTIGQTDWTTLEILDGDFGDIQLHTASATYSTGGGNSSWVWAVSNPFHDGGTYHLQITV